MTIWGFDKTELMKRKSNPITDKAFIEQIYQIMLKDMVLLKEIAATSGGGGNIVQFFECIEETNTTLIFSSERVLCSLADFLNGFDFIVPSPKLDEMKRVFFNSDLNCFSLTEIEISRGLANIAEGLQYLHTVQRKLHVNLNPDSIVLTPSGQWKICGLGFALSFDGSSNNNLKLPSPYFLQQQQNLHLVRLEPDLRYCGPELTLGGLNSPTIRYLSSSCDVFSLGIVIYEVYRFNLDKSIHSTSKTGSLRNLITAIPMSSNSVMHHQSALENLSKLSYNFLPSSSLIQLIMGMIQLVPNTRPSTSDIINNPYYSTGPLAVLKVIDSLRNRDFGTQSSQLINLPTQLSSFPERLLEGSVLPNVCQITSNNIMLLPYSFPVLIYVSQRVTKAKFCSIAGPTMKIVMENNASIEVMQTLLKNIIFIVETFESSYIESSVVTLLSNTLDKAKLPIQVIFNYLYSS